MMKILFGIGGYLIFAGLIITAFRGLKRGKEEESELDEKCLK